MKEFIILHISTTALYIYEMQKCGVVPLHKFARASFSLFEGVIRRHKEQKQKEEGMANTVVLAFESDR
jgi:hypothetical protein